MRLGTLLLVAGFCSPEAAYPRHFTDHNIDRLGCAYLDEEQ